MTRDEHLEFAKRRALEQVEMGDVHHALWTFASFLNLHGETRNHPLILQGSMMLKAGTIDTPELMRSFILDTSLALSERDKESWQ